LSAIRHCYCCYCVFSAHIVEDVDEEPAVHPPVFLSYQWAHQPEVKLLKRHLGDAGYSCWMDVGQMGGGDKLFAKIDAGIRAAKVIVCCVTSNYAESPNCNREVSLHGHIIMLMVMSILQLLKVHITFLRQDWYCQVFRNKADSSWRRKTVCEWEAVTYNEW